MDYRQNLYYAFGHIAYALAAADGTIQKEEKEKLHQLITEGIKNHKPDFDLSEIIFLILEKEHMKMNEAYSWGMKEMKLGSHYLSGEMKKDFIDTLTKVAEAFPPATFDEKKLIRKFGRDLAKIKGDPVFTGGK